MPAFAAPLRHAAAALCLTFVTATAAPAETASADQQQRRDDALLLMTASVFVPGVAAFCHQFVEEDRDILAAAKRWAERNKEQLEKLINAVHAAGDLSTEDQKKLNRLALKVIKDDVEGGENRRLRCKALTEVIESRALDLDTREDLQEPMARVLGRP